MELILWLLRKFIYAKQKLKMLGCLRNVLYKMPRGTRESNEYPNPLWSMVLIYNGNFETKHFYLTERTYWHFKIMWNNKHFILLSQYWTLIALRIKQTTKKGTVLGHILPCAYNKYIHTRIYIYIYIEFGLGMLLEWMRPGL